jgi:hypothetical protein
MPRKYSPRTQPGDLVSVESTPKHFGRIAAQTAKQVILQRIREAERDALYAAYAEREGEIVSGTVHKTEPHQVTLTLGKAEAVLPRLNRCRRKVTVKVSVCGCLFRLSTKLIGDHRLLYPVRIAQCCAGY